MGSIYGWDKMKNGDSMFFPDKPFGSQSEVVKTARAWGKRNNAKFSARTEGNGVRIWRVA
jgi:hypothetical protein